MSLVPTACEGSVSGELKEGVRKELERRAVLLLAKAAANRRFWVWTALLIAALLATPFIVDPPMPPTPMQATCSIEFGAALLKIDGQPNNAAPAAALCLKNRRRLNAPVFLVRVSFSLAFMGPSFRV